MEESLEVRDAVLAFYEGINANAVERFDYIVSASPTTLVIGTCRSVCKTRRSRPRGALPDGRFGSVAVRR